MLALWVVFYEATCPPGELLSEGVDRARAKHRVTVPLAITLTALHLLRLLNPKVDPYKWLDLVSQPLKGKLYDQRR